MPCSRKCLISQPSTYPNLLQFFLVCASVVSYVAFVVPEYVPHLFLMKTYPGQLQLYNIRQSYIHTVLKPQLSYIRTVLYPNDPIFECLVSKPSLSQ